MKRWTKTLALLLCCAMLFSLAGCGEGNTAESPSPAPSESAAPTPSPSQSTEPSPEPAGIYTPGTYTGSAQGFGGLVSAAVTVDANAITAVTLTGNDETQGIGSKAIENLPEAIVAKGADFDDFSGATFTSKGIREAVNAALAQARGEVPTASGMTPGTYTATAAGHRGEITVEVKVDETSITGVTVLSHNETYGVGWGLSTSPIETIPAAIVENQSLAVDAVASASVTSGAIKSAVGDCIGQAGGDVADFQAAQPHESGDETYNVDILVLGAGPAGLSAAVAAQEAGASVLLMEKTGVTGGSAARSGGKILAADTQWQAEQGFEDSAELMYDFLMSYDRDGLMNADLVRQFCDNSLENIMWLSQRGVEVKDVEPIHSSLTPWRVHNTKGGGGMTDGIGGQITAPLTNLYEGNGGEILYNCRATELIKDGNGAVVGAIGEKRYGGTVTVRAGSTIICTGGFAKSPELLATYASFLPANYAGVPDTNVGDGLLMAQRAGADSTVNPGLQLVYVNYDCYIGIAEESGLILDATGNRVVNEWTYQSHVASALARLGSPVGYYITATKGGVCAEPYPMVQWGVTMEQVPHAATLEELAGLIGVDAATLKDSVTRYNDLCAIGEDLDFGKPAEYMIPVEGDTYYAFRMNPSSSVTFGGLVINGESRVLDTNGDPIPGLFAAGEVAFSGLFSDEYPCCGMAIGSAVYFGRNAVDAIMAEK